MEETVQNALKVQSSLLPRRRAVERLYVTSCKMTVHMIARWSDTSRLAN